MNICFYYADKYKVDLPEKHRFPMEKYRLLREMLIREELVEQTQLIESQVINYDTLLLAHEKSYVDDVLSLRLDHKRVRRVGLPLTKEMEG